METYWDLRAALSRIIPVQSVLFKYHRDIEGIKEKGRKRNYAQWDLINKQYVPQERLLDTEEIDSFIRISVRAMACPMPLNMDTYDSFTCGYNCRYCFANAFRMSLYTAFFDNAKEMGYRACDPLVYMKRMDALMKYRNRYYVNDIMGTAKAVALEIPIRFGITYEDFLPVEKERGISLQLLNYLADNEYPVMINTKSDLVGTPPYVEALSRNKARSAVHITLISSEDRILKELEPGAPSYRERLRAIRNLTMEGVRVVARIEPFMWLLNDDKDSVEEYIDDIKAAGVTHLTFDNYSYTPSARNSGIRQSFANAGWDFDRIYLAMSESQPFGSILLGYFMEEFKKRGLECSTFDMGNVPTNNDDICCSVGDWFGSGFNYGCSVMAARYIVRSEVPVGWADFKKWVDSRGGFLTPQLEYSVHELWNGEGSLEAYSQKWAGGLRVVGYDSGGAVWSYCPGYDFRETLKEGLLNGI